MIEEQTICVKLRNKELPEAFCIMATMHKFGVWVYWTRIKTMDDKSDKCEFLSHDDFNEKYVLL